MKTLLKLSLLPHTENCEIYLIRHKFLAGFFMIVLFPYLVGCCVSDINSQSAKMHPYQHLRETGDTVQDAVSYINAFKSFCGVEFFSDIANKKEKLQTFFGELQEIEIIDKNMQSWLAKTKEGREAFLLSQGVINDEEIKEISTDLVFAIKRKGLVQALASFEEVIFVRDLTDKKDIFYNSIFNVMKVLKNLNPYLFKVTYGCNNGNTHWDDDDDCDWQIILATAASVAGSDLTVLTASVAPPVGIALFGVEVVLYSELASNCSDAKN